MNKIKNYISVGGIAFLAEYLIFIFLISMISLLTAQILSWCVGYIISFYGHSNLTFKTTSSYKFSQKRMFTLYGITAISTLMLSTILVHILSGFIQPEIAKLIAMVSTAICSYVVLNRLIFVR